MARQCMKACTAHSVRILARLCSTNNIYILCIYMEQNKYGQGPSSSVWKRAATGAFLHLHPIYLVHTYQHRGPLRHKCEVEARSSRDHGEENENT